MTGPVAAPPIARSTWRLPLLKPGKSLKFASLPEGQDPDDLVRNGGREAINEVIGAARPLAHVLWTRETEAGSLDTPERRAAFEARLAEVIAAIGDDAVRKYYRREFADRLRQLFEGTTAFQDAAAARPDGDRRLANGAQGRQERVATHHPPAAIHRSLLGRALANPTWWRARNWRRAPSIAVTALPFPAARL